MTGNKATIAVSVAAGVVLGALMFGAPTPTLSDHERCMNAMNSAGLAVELCEPLLTGSQDLPPSLMRNDDGSIQVTFWNGDWVRLEEDGTIAASNAGEWSEVWTW